MANHTVDGSRQHAVPFAVPVQGHSPDLKNSTHGKQAKLSYYHLSSRGFYFLIPPIVVLVSQFEIAMPNGGDWSVYGLMNLALLLGSVLLVAYVVLDSIPRPTYLVDFTCFRPPRELKISKEEFLKLAEKSGNFDSAAMEFQRHVVMASGIGDESAVPKSVFLPAREISLREGQEEAAVVMLGAVDELMAATGIRPREIRILVVNCGVLTTTPSLSSLLINHYKLRQDIRSFNLGGMGCAAGVVAVEVARGVLRSHPGSSYALVVSTEIVTSVWYPGSHLQILASNCVLRMGAAAMLLSNRRLDWWRSKYQLEKIVRTHRAGTDEHSFNSLCLKEDINGRRGLFHSHDFLEAANRALKAHVASLGTKKKLDFFQHVCILPTSKKLLDAFQQSLKLTDEQMEASRKTLEKFGNTSSSSVWYELAYLEAFGWMKKGDIVWQIAIGSGLKCNSMMWKALRTIRIPRKSPWIENNA